MRIQLIAQSKLQSLKKRERKKDKILNFWRRTPVAAKFD
jgi:hypothetical protein